MDNAIRFKEVTGTIEQKKEQYKKQWIEAKKEVKSGKVICITDLIANAENIHISQIDNK